MSVQTVNRAALKCHQPLENIHGTVVMIWEKMLHVLFNEDHIEVSTFLSWSVKGTAESTAVVVESKATVTLDSGERYMIDIRFATTLDCHVWVEVYQWEHRIQGWSFHSRLTDRFYVC